MGRLSRYRIFESGQELTDNRWKKSVLFCRSVVDKITYAKVVSNEKRKEKVLKTLLKASRLLTFSMGVGD